MNYSSFLFTVVVFLSVRVCVCFVCQLLRSSLVNNRTQAKVAEELGMQEFAITNDKTKRPAALRTKTLADLLECTFALWRREKTFASRGRLKMAGVKHPSSIPPFPFVSHFTPLPLGVVMRVVLHRLEIGDMRAENKG